MKKLLNWFLTIGLIAAGIFSIIYSVKTFSPKQSQPTKKVETFVKFVRNDSTNITVIYHKFIYNCNFIKSYDVFIQKIIGKNGEKVIKIKSDDLNFSQSFICKDEISIKIINKYLSNFLEKEEIYDFDKISFLKEMKNFLEVRFLAENFSDNYFKNIDNKRKLSVKILTAERLIMDGDFKNYLSFYDSDDRYPKEIDSLIKKRDEKIEIFGNFFDFLIFGKDYVIDSSGTEIYYQKIIRTKEKEITHIPYCNPPELIIDGNKIYWDDFVNSNMKIGTNYDTMEYSINESKTIYDYKENNIKIIYLSKNHR